MNFRSPARGQSMIEMIAAVAVFAILISMTMVVANTTTDSFNEKIQVANLQVKGERALKKMTDEIGDGTLLEPKNVTTGGYIFYDAEIRYKVPTALENNPVGLPVAKQYIPTNPTFGGTGISDPNADFGLNLKFGWRDDNRQVRNMAVLGYPITSLQGPGLKTLSAFLPPGLVLDSGGKTPAGEMGFRFVLNPQSVLGRNGIFKEELEGIDIDGDGLRASRYAVGYIESFIFIFSSGSTTSGYVLDSSRQRIAESNVILPLSSTDPKVTPSNPSKLKTTRLFSPYPYPVNVDSPKPTRLDINLWLLQIGDDRRPRMTQCGTSIFLRNGGDDESQ